ncbi:protein-cysteine N-palmitoyltransferase Rasp isoform X1 [Athalia rosae]|uniref:protein-cysteine N-palmitoyltransferase Rasp isoform X1 n=1 Tax=Athalia rosae TaxID=37344 RepID=UPI002033C6A2|nr:protein-cysteine N-palmitoyltransferase Rasp isoform X1 [Athalia rosae]
MKQSIITLSRVELSIYFVGWVSGIFYAIYHVHLQTSANFEYYDDVYGDFSPGWSWIGGKRDVSDPEWKVWIPFLYRLFPWVSVHIVGGQIIRSFFNSSILCCWYIIITLALILSSVGFPTVIFLLMQPLLSCLFMLTKGKTLLWTTHLLFVGILNVIKNPDCIVSRWLGVNEDEYNLIIIVFAWIQLKSIAFSLDCVAKYEQKSFKGFPTEFVQILAYCLYLPTFFFGQLILYQEFVNGINTPFEKWTSKRVGTVFLYLSRYLFWVFFTEFAMHFVYINVLHFHPKMVSNFSSWALYGFGYCMGQYFSNKYVVLYGFSSAIARAENIADLKTPKCIGRIHLYSDMWKYFDRGLHKFLVRYIYLPIAGPTSVLRKIFASFTCFAFVYVWHGTRMYIFIWSALNFVGVTIESLARIIANSKIYVEAESKLLGPRNVRRFHCMIASPLLAMSAISNFYFFGGRAIGNIFMQRIFSDSWTSLITLFSILYCCCQISTELKNREIKKCLTSKSD